MQMTDGDAATEQHMNFFLNSYIPRRNCGDLTKPGDLGGSGGAEFGISCIECRLLVRRLDLGGKTGPRSRGSE